MKASVFLIIGRTFDGKYISFLLNGHSGAESLGKGSEGALYRDDIIVGDGNGNACGNMNGHSSYS